MWVTLKRCVRQTLCEMIFRYYYSKYLKKYRIVWLDWNRILLYRNVSTTIISCIVEEKSPRLTNTGCNYFRIASSGRSSHRLDRTCYYRETFHLESRAILQYQYIFQVLAWTNTAAYPPVITLHLYPPPSASHFFHAMHVSSTLLFAFSNDGSRAGILCLVFAMR